MLSAVLPGAIAALANAKIFMTGIIMYHHMKGFRIFGRYLYLFRLNNTANRL
jgi:hypothetical protein